jgi:heptosyltransferase-3
VRPICSATPPRRASTCPSRAALDLLLVRAGALGDVLLLRPAIAALASAGHRVRLLAPAPAASLLRGAGGVDDVLAWEAPETAALLSGARTDGPLARALAAADVVVAWSRSAPLLEALAAPGRRLLAHDPSPPPGGPHAARWLAQAVEPLVAGSVAPDAPKPLRLDTADHDWARARCAELPGAFVAVHPGSGSRGKNWPRARFFEAARALSRGGRFLLAAGPAEAELDPPSDALVAREWPLARLAAALSHAGVYFGNDSGVSHLAAAVGAPTLALFGPTDPALWAPVGPRVSTLRAAHGALEALEVRSVVAAADALRSGASGPPSG